ncbi:DUF3592 domain-containing protein [Nitrospina watsonii]|uniref:DUF3592 domain-containing protein n=1 Tax=Nitrospina watsonii TaxID=1323948 RepID=A0ABN8W0E0_9BACT|nr:DUF3592 domain-containing protein [Nitrospina watsonii]CAI2719063.1 conserved protein of unknown function [Nitrospina watsonii]
MVLQDWMGLAAAAVGLGAMVYAKRIEKKAKAARFWPTASGTVKRSSVKLERSGNHAGSYNYGNRTFRADVHYRYKVGSRTYTNNKIMVGGQLQLALKDRAEQHCHNYPVGTEVDVIYNPDNPQEAYLEPHEESSGFIQLVGGVFLAIGLIAYFHLF